ncbi:hypothetical protein FRB97_004821, partial [Tulasnella sp. 331]
MMARFPFANVKVWPDIKVDGDIVAMLLSVLLPKLSHAARSWYHLLNNCTLLHGTTTLVLNTADAQIIPSLEDDATFEHFKWRRLEIFSNQRVSELNPGIGEDADEQWMSDVLISQSKHDGFIEDWLRGVHGVARVASTRHFTIYTGELAILGIFDTQFETVAFSPIEGLDTSSPNDNALLSPASPSLFKLLTQAMVDARMSKEEGKLPLEKISPPWNTAALSVKIQQYPFRNVANTEPREPAYIKMIYIVLTQSPQHGNGFPTIRRGSLTPPPPTPTTEQTAVDVEQGYDGDVYEIMGLRVAPTTTVGNASTGL